MAHDVQLTTEERQRTLAAHHKVMGDKWFVTTSFELRNICAEMGLQPALEEMEAALDRACGELDFAGLLRFVAQRKVDFYAPEPRDADTIRAFVAVGGCGDKSGHVECGRLRDTCERFSLSVDIDGIFREADTDGGNTLEFQEFQLMLDSRQGESRRPSKLRLAPLPADAAAEQRRALALGFDYQMLVARERRDEPVRVPAAPSPPSGLQGSPQTGPLRRRRESMHPAAPKGGDALPALDPGGGQDTPRKQRLRQKGINPALWGGDLLDSLDIDSGGCSPVADDRRKHRANKRHGRAAAAHAAADADRNCTRPIGRRGLLLDDPPLLPRHYPQQQQQQAALTLPSLTPARDSRSPRRQRLQSPRGDVEPSPVLAAIDRRVHELGRHRSAQCCGQRLAAASSGSVFTELLARTAPTPVTATP
eukprot:TRINITY_DN2785_c0_g1_i1.p1 TRINITY_DN2785_c0_g1~~TRINITY_DN2785_c0_g1_i1.p1  ORF type:complete len:447 (+),score=168.34 TRINITY_DN2785_c0_g1_i1:80-1342(+)